MMSILGSFATAFCLKDKREIIRKIFAFRAVSSNFCWDW